MQNFIFKTILGNLLITFYDETIYKICSTNSLETAKSPPLFIKKLSKKIKLVLKGKNQDFSEFSLDMTQLTDFQKKVYENARKIKFGTTCTYKDLAIKINNPKASRAIGMTMKNNPFLIVIPCHRVIGSNGKLVGFNMKGGIKTKEKLLKIEKDQF